MTWMRGSSSVGRQQQRADVVQQREIAEQHARDARARRRPGDASAMPVAVATVPSMPARPRLACTGHLLAAEQRVGDAHEPRRAEHQPVVRPGRPPHGVDERGAIERRADGGELGADRAEPLLGNGGRRARRRRGRAGARSTDAARDACSHAPSHSRSGSPVATATASTAVVTPLRLSGSPGPAHRERPRRSGSDSSAADSRLSVGCPSTTTRSMRPPSCGSREQRAVAVDEVAAEPRAADDLGDERPAARVGERLGIRPGIGAGDARPCAARARGRTAASSGSVGQVGLADAAAALIERAGCLVLGAARRPGRRRDRSSADRGELGGRARRASAAGRRRAARGTAGSGAPARARACRRRAPPRPPRRRPGAA